MKSTALFLVLLASISAFPQSGDGGRVQMAVPGVEGALEMDTRSAKPQTRLRSDGKEIQLRAMDRPDGLEITAFLQRVTFAATAEKCRDEWWPGTKNAVALQRDDLEEKVVKNGIATVEYIIPEFKGIKVNQKNMHAYLGSGDLCAEIHLSKAGFTPADQKLFEDLLSTVKLVPDAPATTVQHHSQDHDSSFYFGEGSKLYLKQDYASAAVSYQKAFDLEKDHRMLSKDYFRVMVDNLGMSYGMTGKLPQAKATFEYGVTQDPEYPMFYYNLACTYGEMSRMNEALEQLRLAYKHKANMISGETFPDPMKDDSFRYFVDKPGFVSAVHEMQK